MTSTRILSAALVLALGSRVGSLQPSAPPPSLPAAEIVAGYLEAIGGRARLGRVSDATLEFNVVREGREPGATSTRRKAPASVRDEGASGVNVGSPGAALGRAPDGTVRVYEGLAAAQARLQAALEASYLLDVAQQGIAARTLGVEDAGGAPAHAVEFSRGEARLVYLFDVASKRLVKVRDELRKASVLYADFRSVDGVLEPHRIQLLRDGRTSGLTLLLTRVRYNTGIGDEIFAMPSP